MYFTPTFTSSEVGDLTVFAHDGKLHLFHLCLPSHDVVAHLESEDGLHWQPCPHALHVGDPGECDDDMIWTMHIFPWEGRFQMLYTALATAEQGRVNRTGMAVSDDLYTWTKVDHNPVAAPDGRWYEADTSDSGRADWRDPFPWVEDGVVHALVCAHRNQGVYNRRGTVGYFTSTDGQQWEVQPSFYWPNTSSEWEVPTILKLAERYYLLGHYVTPQLDIYRVADSLAGPWRRPLDDVLLPPPNHAFAPVMWEDQGWLYHWISVQFDWLPEQPPGRGIAPPKEAVAEPDGSLRLRSYRGWEALCGAPVEGQGQAVDGVWTPTADGVRGEAGPGFGAYWLPGEHADFVLEAEVEPQGARAFGLIWRADGEAERCTKAALLPGRQRAELQRLTLGTAYPRLGRGHLTLQESYCRLDGGPLKLRVVCWGPYVEVSVNEKVILCSFTMTRRSGRVGWHLEDGAAIFRRATLRPLPAPPAFPA